MKKVRPVAITTNFRIQSCPQLVQTTRFSTMLHQGLDGQDRGKAVITSFPCSTVMEM